MRIYLITMTLISIGSTLHGGEKLISVELHSKKEYVLGEPVVLDIKATNVSGRDLNASEGEISIYLSKDDHDFQRFQPGLSDVISCGKYSPRNFALGTTQERREWVVYTEMPDEKKVDDGIFLRNSPKIRNPVMAPADKWGRLALDKPGRYWIKVGYPLAVWDSMPKGQTYESNTVEISVKPPKGVDVKVWQKLNNPRYLFFLQAAQVPWIYQGDKRRTFPEVPGELVDLFTKMPTSSYHDDIKEALTRYYWHRRRPLSPKKAFADEELTLIRKAVGIKDFVNGPFPDDARLDAKITFDFPPMTTRLQAFDYFSDQTGVPLAMDPRMEKSIVTPLPKMSLRTFMRRWNFGLTKWIKHGDGYKLILQCKVRSCISG